MKTYKSESDNIPQEWDATSSMRVVYHNYNIEQTERYDDISDDKRTPRTVYTYDVDEYTKEEYAAFEEAERALCQRKLRAEVDFLLIMGGWYNV